MSETVMYRLGRLTAHSSDSSGMCDVGISIGLGEGWMLYAGEVPDRDDWCLMLYGQTDSRLVAGGVDPEDGRAFVEQIAGAIYESRVGR